MRPAILLLALACLSTAPLTVPQRARADGFPYETKGGVEAGLLLGAAASFGAGWYLDRHFEPHDLLEISSKRRSAILVIDRCAAKQWSLGANRASDWLVGLQIAAPASLTLDGGGSRQPDRVAMMYGETMLLTSGLTYLMKNAFDRTRPFVYNDDPAIPAALKQERTARKSFPSGHTANAFASMVYLATVFEKTNPDSKHHDLVWAGCLTSAAITGALRIAAGRHFPSDVLIGAAVGSLVGWVVPRVHEVDDLTDPAATGKAAVSVSWRVGF